MYAANAQFFPEQASFSFVVCQKKVRARVVQNISL
jgi:hypothetical protein